MISRYTNLLHIAKIATTKKKRNRIAKQAKISTMDCTHKLNAGLTTFYTSFPQQKNQIMYLSILSSSGKCSITAG